MLLAFDSNKFIVPENRGVKQRLVGAVPGGCNNNRAAHIGIAAAHPVLVARRFTAGSYIDWPTVKRRSGRICIWGANLLSAQDFCYAVNAAVGANEAGLINAVERVIQPGNIVRFDIYVERGSEQLIKQSISVFPRCQNWYIRYHVGNPLLRRPLNGRRRQQQVRRDRFPSMLFRGVSWNVRSINGKRSDIEVLCKKVGIDVVAIQETHRGVDAWPIKLTGFNCVEQPATTDGGDRRGVHGIMLAVRKGLQAYSVGNPTGNYMFLRVFSQQLAYPIICGCVYVPVSGCPNRRVVIRNLRTEIAKLKIAYPNAKLLVMGDFNGSIQQVHGWLLEGRDGILDLNTVPIQGPSTATWFGPRGRSSTIDHVLVSSDLMKDDGAIARVDNTWDISDHKPLITAVRVRKVQRTIDQNNNMTRRTWNRIAFPKVEATAAKALAVATHNRWSVLAPEMTVEERGNLFIDTCHHVAEQTQLVARQAPRNRTGRTSPRFNLQDSTVEAVNGRRAAYEQWQNAIAQNADPVVVEQLRQRYHQVRKETKRIVRDDRVNAFIKHIAKGIEYLKVGDHKQHWRWLQGMMKGKSNGSATTNGLNPLVKSRATGQLLTDPKEVAQEWANHYGNLAADQTGHSRDKAHWRQFLDGHRLSRLNINGNITWEEVVSALRKMRNGKAPGEDGITADFLKLCLTAENEDNVAIGNGGPNTPMGLELFRMITQMWKSVRIPNQWNHAVVVSIFKKGDELLPENYRGISLISVVLKLLMAILTKRLSDELEERGLLRKEQAGFRSHQEVVSQFVALQEICQRRRIVGKKTWICFVDLQKAYDMVPQAALFTKLEQVGIRGRFMRFLKMVYQGSRIAVRTTDGDVISKPLMRGVRQGCPMSPVLFDVFINDILDGVRGAKVPGLLLGEDRVPGLLVADDLTLIAGSKRNLAKMVRKVGTWASKWEMKVGVAKCGVMIVDGTDNDRQNAIFEIGGERIPVVRTYRYLGLDFNDELSIPKMIESRLAASRKFVYGIKQFLAAKSIPLTSRVLVTKACVVSRLLYGAELWGMNQCYAVKPQMLLNQVTRWLVGAKATSTAVPLGAVQRELDLPTIEALAAARRARLFNKAKEGGLKTVLNDLVARPDRRRGGDTWVKGSQRWLKRFQLFDRVDDVVRQVVSNVWMRSLTTKRYSNATAAKDYVASEFEVTNNYKRLAERLPQLARGLQALTAMRIGSLWTGHKFVVAGLLPARFRNKCPLCQRRVNGGETIDHLLVDCVKWNPVRIRRMNDLILKANRVVDRGMGVGNNVQVGSVARRKAITKLLLGGKVNGVGLDGWTFSGRLGEVTQVALHGLGSVTVAEFMQEIIPLRTRLIRQLMDSTKVQGPPG